MSIDTSRLKTIDLARIAESYNRMILTIAWFQLDNLITKGVAPIPQPSGVWRAYNVPAERGQERKLGYVADNALRTMRAQRGAPVNATATTDDVRQAKRAVRNVLIGWSVERAA